MRQMISNYGTAVLDVKQYIMLSNGWEYYVIDEPTKKTDAFCLVMGFETELGYVHLPEIQQHIVARTRDLASIMPATGYKWVD